MKKVGLKSKLNFNKSVISDLTSENIKGGCPTGSLCWFTDGCTQTSCAPDCEITQGPECDPKK